MNPLEVQNYIPHLANCIPIELHEAYSERAAIKEYMGGLTREEAEERAFFEVTGYAPS